MPLFLCLSVAWKKWQICFLDPFSRSVPAKKENRNAPGSGGAKTKEIWVWSKTTSTSREEEWEELLAGYPPATVAFLTAPGSSALRLRVYAAKKETARLEELFGGKQAPLDPDAWQSCFKEKSKPFSVRGKFLVFGDEAQWESHKKINPEKPSLWVPANMAFGTGSHPTTAGCLRVLADEAEKLRGGKWVCADLGAGSGILALAARLLGAHRVEALDYDPVCTREIRENARNNHLSINKIQTGDVHGWHPSSPCDIVVANLFSETLISAADPIVRGLAPCGTLIFSGVLREQFPGVAAAFESRGFAVVNHSQNKKWVVGSARKIAGKL